jgi:hypothetical protein
MPKPQEESLEDNLEIFVFDLGSPEDADTPTFNAGRDIGPIWHLFCIFGLIKLISTQGATHLLIQVECQEMIASKTNRHEIGILDFVRTHPSESTGWPSGDWIFFLYPIS